MVLIISLLLFPLLFWEHLQLSIPRGHVCLSFCCCWPEYYTENIDFICPQEPEHHPNHLHSRRIDINIVIVRCFMISRICMPPCPDVGRMMHEKAHRWGCLSPKPYVSELSHPHTCTWELDLHMLSFAVTFVRFAFWERVSLKTFITGAKCLYNHLRNITDDQTQSMEKCSACRGDCSKQGVRLLKTSHVRPEESYNLKYTHTSLLPASSLILALFFSPHSSFLGCTTPHFFSNPIPVLLPL